jgi:hypothetical protein
LENGNLSMQWTRRDHSSATLFSPTVTIHFESVEARVLAFWPRYNFQLVASTETSRPRLQGTFRFRAIKQGCAEPSACSSVQQVGFFHRSVLRIARWRKQ